jgi:hypothetical protein
MELKKTRDNLDNVSSKLNGRPNILLLKFEEIHIQLNLKTTEK